MIGSLFRFSPNVIRVQFIQQSILRAPELVKSRRSCSLIQQDTAKEITEPKLGVTSEQNELQTDDDAQNNLGKSIERRRALAYPRSLAEAVYRNEFLQNMVDLGVNLYEIQDKRPRDFDFIVSLRSWDPDPPERIRFLLQLGVRQDDITKIITKNPRILKENLEDLQIRVNYLLSKKFTAEDISKMAAICPKLLSMKVVDIDTRLGYFQQGFKLNGNDVRRIATNYPWLISKPERQLSNTLNMLKDTLSFNNNEIKTLLLNNGNIWKADPDDVKNVAMFLHKDLKMSHKKIVEFGHLLTKSVLAMKHRYSFMQYMKRDNFDPRKENYQSYDILWQDKLEDFCKKLKTDMDAFDLFTKSM